MRFPFTTEARTQLRALDRTIALRILEMLTRFGESGVGDVSPLHGEWKGGYRLRCGDHRVIFRPIEEGWKSSRLAIVPRFTGNVPRSIWSQRRPMPRTGQGWEIISQDAIKGDGKAPMVGYRSKDGVFDILWIDHDFTLYDHS